MTLFYQQKGAGKNIILLHGLASSHHDWDWISPKLVSEGYQVIYPDLPGHGDSPGPDDPYKFTMDAAFQQLDAWFRKLNLNQPVTLIGHSLGAYLSLRLAHTYASQISKLVLVSPFYSPKQIFFLARYAMRNPKLSEQAFRLVKFNFVYSFLYMTELITGKYPAEARMQTAVDFTRTQPASMRFPALATDLSSILDQIQCPTLVIWGEQDYVLNPKQRHKLIKSIPNAVGFTISRCGHEPHLTQMKIFNDLVLSFINENEFISTN